MEGGGGGRGGAAGPPAGGGAGGPAGGAGAGAWAARALSRPGAPRGAARAQLRAGRPCQTCLVRGGGLEVLRWEDWGGGSGGEAPGLAWPQPRAEALYRPAGGGSVLAAVVVPRWGAEPGSDALLVVQGGEDAVDPPTCWLLGWGRASGEAPPCRPARGTPPGEEGIVELSNGRGLLEPAPDSGPALPAVRRLSCLTSAPFQVQQDHLVVAVGLSENFLHVVSLRRGTAAGGGAAGTPGAGAPAVRIESTCVELQYGAFTAGPGGATEREPVLRSVLSMEFVPTLYGPRDLMGNLWLALLYADEEVDFRIVHAKCMCVSLTGSTPSVRPGPWGFQNIHPTSSVLKVSGGTHYSGWDGGEDCAPSSTRGAGPPPPPHVLIFSSDSIMLVGAAESLPQRGEPVVSFTPRKVQYSLPGLVTCVTETAPGVFAVGDSQGGVYLLDCSQTEAWTFTTVAEAGWKQAPSPAQSLCQVEVAESEEGNSAPRALLACSSSGDSRVLVRRDSTGGSEAEDIPLRLKRIVIAGTQTTPENEGIVTAPWRVTSERWEHVDAPLFHSFSPVNTSLLAEDFVGPGEHSLFLGCGLAQSGTLRRVLAGCRARSLATVPSPSSAGAPDLLALERGPGGSPHAFLSYDAEDVTESLRIETAAITPCCIDGFDPGTATVAVGSPDGQDFFVQVVRSGFRCCAAAGDARGGAPSALLKSDPRRAISHAVFCRDRLVLARGSDVEAFQFHGPGDVRDDFTLALPHEVSALAAFQLPGVFSGAYCVAAGLWESNCINVYSCTDCEQLASTGTLPHGCQARSLQVSEAALLVGSSTGDVLAFALGYEGGLHLVSRVRVGAVAVRLFPVPTRGGGREDGCSSFFYAQSDQDAVLEVGGAHAAEESSSYGGHSFRLRARRVHVEGGHLASVCPVPVAGVDCGILCASSDSALSVGYIDLEETAQHDTLHLGETVVGSTFHPPSRCLALITEDSEGESWLRVVDGVSMNVVASVKMYNRELHTVCCINCVDLPRIVPPESGSKNPGSTVVCEDRAYIVTSSYMVTSGTGSTGMQGNSEYHSILSVYGLDECNGNFDLRLLGIHPLPSVCLSLVGVAPRPRAHGGPNLLLGSSNAVLSMRVVVDDTGYNAERMLENAAAAISSMSPTVQALINKLVVSAGISSDAPGQDSAGPTPEVRQLRSDVQTPWHQRATFSLVQVLKTPGRSTITSITSAKPSDGFLATEFMGACLLLQFSAELPGVLQIMSKCSGGDLGLGHATATAALGEGTFAIGASMPTQLLICRRNPDAEKLFQKAAASAQKAAFEAGRNRSAAAGGEQDHLGSGSGGPASSSVSALQVPVPPEMDILARVPTVAGGHIVALHQGRLGLRPQPEPAASLGERPAGPSHARLVYLTADGAVGHLFGRTEND